ncbi:MAG: alpha/beta hydrolase [Anaerolineales bacterium]|nr:alpha/beta hydrolase [Anaerolineales bacterium]
MRWWFAAGLLGLLLLGLGFAAWALAGSGPEPAALAALAGDEHVLVETSGPWIIFRTAGAVPATTGLVLYPGARVDARAYAPAARAIAAQGYLVVVVPMPLRLAVLAPERAADVLGAFPNVEFWAVGGHSLGGAMAARFAYDHPGVAHGLVLWAASPPEGADLATYDLAVVSIYGTADGLLAPAAVEAGAARLPPGATWVAIEGGNHAQFGRYGPQAGDGPAAITSEDQQAQVVAATAALLARLDGGR